MTKKLKSGTPFVYDENDRVVGIRDPHTGTDTDLVTAVTNPGGVVVLIGPDNAPIEVGGRVFSPTQYGAVSGAADVTAAAEACITALAAAGGGVVYWPPGVWFADNLSIVTGIRHVGAGSAVTTIKPVTPTGTCFKVKAAAAISYASWSYMTIAGPGKPTVDWSGMDLKFLDSVPATDYTAQKTAWFTHTGSTGIDMSLATIWDAGLNIDLVVTGHHTGIYSSANDRKPQFLSCVAADNHIGMYIQNNHPHMINCDFRNNDVGVMAFKAYDWTVSGCSFVRNKFGLLEDPTKVGSSVRQSFIENTTFFDNTCGGAVVSSRTVFSNCWVTHGVGVATKSDSFGLRLRGAGCSFSNGCVSSEGSAGFGDAAFVLSGISGSDNCLDTNISDTFVDTGNVGRFDKTGTASMWRLNMSGVRGKARGYLFKNEAMTRESVFVNNTVRPTKPYTISELDAFLDIAESDTLSGNVISGNIFRPETAATLLAALIRADLKGSVCVGNVVRGTIPFVSLGYDDKTVFKDNSFGDLTQSTFKGTKVVVPGTIAAGTTVLFSETVNNFAVNLGKPVVVSYSNELGGCLLFGEAAYKKIKFTFYNPTSNPITLPEGTLYFTSA